MQGLRFEFDWVDPEGINGPELSATWAALQIRADDSIITRVLDTRAKTVRDFVHVPLYPLAEWLVSNWWFITREIQNPTKGACQDFRRRHSMVTSREGYAIPNLEMVPYGNRTLISWRKYVSPWTRVEFLDDGHVRMDVSEFRESCADFIDQVIRRLESVEVTDTFLQEEWEAINTADGEETRFCETAAGLGWDPYSLDDVGRGNILDLSDMLGELLDEAVSALESTDPLKGSAAILSAIEEAKLNSLKLERICEFRDEVGQESTAGLHPWDVGYKWAARLRQSLGIEDQTLHSMPELAELLGEDPQLLDRVTMPSDSFAHAPLIDGVVTHYHDNPAFAFRRLRDDARRFQFCRSLAEVLVSPHSDSLITRSTSECQQRNRAFAAEFLAPSSTLRRMVSHDVVDGEDVDDLAIEFGVSSYVIKHQLENHHIAQVVERGVSHF